MAAASWLACPRSALASGADFLKLEPGPRASAMAGAFTAVADDATAVRWNPAGLRQLARSEVAFSQRQYLGDLRYFEAFAARNFGRAWSSGFALGYLDYGKIERVDRFGTGSTDQYGARDLVAELAIARDVFLEGVEGRLRFGGGAKLIRREIERESANGYALDVGVHYEKDRWRYGSTIQNFGPAVGFRHVKEQLPLAFRGGVAWEAHERVLVSGDVALPGSVKDSLRLGTEVLAARVQWTDFLLRGGFSLADGVSKGVSLGFGLVGFNWEFSYSWKAYGPFDYGHWVGVSYRFHQGSERETPKEFNRRRVSGMYEKLMRWYHVQMDSGHMSRKWALQVLERIIGRYEPLGVDVAEAKDELARMRTLPAETRDIEPEAALPDLDPLLETPRKKR